MHRLANKFWNSVFYSPDEPAGEPVQKPPASTGAVVNTPPGSSGSETPFQGLPDPDRKYLVETLKVTDLPGVVTALRDRETRLGASVQVPALDAPLEARKPLYEKVRPKDAAGYKLDLPKNLPEHFPYDGELAKSARTTFHGLGLDPVQAAGVHDWYVQETAKQFKASVDAVAAIETREHEALTKLWGTPDSDSYKGKLAMAGVAADKLGIMDELKQLGALSADGGIRNSKIVRALAEVGEALYKEGGAPRLGELTVTVNPWAADTWNETQQGTIFKADRERAKRLIVAAGKRPEDYGFPAAA